MTGQLVKTTLKVDIESVRAYADLTDDYNPIHLDPAFAATTPMGGVIAHGTMSVCLLWQAIYRTFAPEMLSSAELDVRFVKPVRLGERLEAGGQRDAEDPRLYTVWVRADDGAERLAGTLRTAAIPAQERAPS